MQECAARPFLLADLLFQEIRMQKSLGRSARIALAVTLVWGVGCGIGCGGSGSHAPDAKDGPKDSTTGSAGAGGNGTDGGAGSDGGAGKDGGAGSDGGAGKDGGAGSDGGAGKDG